jgi:3-vinyl bacteriochlorophyllide hydratase
MAITARRACGPYDASGGKGLLSLATVQERREASIWTRIHPIFAIGQLGVFVMSVALLALYAVHLVPFTAVYLSVLFKMVLMIGAIVTGSLWEHDVFGEWWFAEEFFVEDVMTLNVFWLHIAVVAMYFAHPDNVSAVAGLLAFAYVIYAINVAQYIIQHAGAHARPAQQSAARKTEVAA